MLACYINVSIHLFRNPSKVFDFAIPSHILQYLLLAWAAIIQPSFSQTLNTLLDWLIVFTYLNDVKIRNFIKQLFCREIDSEIILMSG